MCKRILVIDDEESIRKSFVLAFEGAGYTVDTADSGEKGIEMGQRDKYGLIFLDLKMPGMDGIEVLRELRKTDKDTPIYVVTAFYREFLNQLKRAKEGGIDFEVLRKPVDSEQLILIVRGILEGPEVCYV